jgi:DNA-binding NarL/FixJ family response regulator
MSREGPPTIRLVVADDHPLVLRGIEVLLASEPDCEILASCSDGNETLEAVRLHQPGILVLDSRMPGRDSLEVIRTLARERSSVRIVLHAEGSEEERIAKAVELGIRGLALKEWPPETLLQCIRRVHAGEYWLERRSAAEALEKLMRKAPEASSDPDSLTHRQREILALVCEGLRNKEIASKLSLSEATVKVHLRKLSAKLQVRGRLALLRYARDYGLF